MKEKLEQIKILESELEKLSTGIELDKKAEIEASLLRKLEQLELIATKQTEAISQVVSVDKKIATILEAVGRRVRQRDIVEKRTFRRLFNGMLGMMATCLVLWAMVWSAGFIAGYESWTNIILQVALTIVGLAVAMSCLLGWSQGAICTYDASISVEEGVDQPPPVEPAGFGIFFVLLFSVFNVYVLYPIPTIAIAVESALLLGVFWGFSDDFFFSILNKSDELAKIEEQGAREERICKGLDTQRVGLIAICESITSEKEAVEETTEQLKNCLETIKLTVSKKSQRTEKLSNEIRYLKQEVADTNEQQRKQQEKARKFAEQREAEKRRQDAQRKQANKLAEDKARIMAKQQEKLQVIKEARAKFLVGYEEKHGHWTSVLNILEHFPESEDLLYFKPLVFGKASNTAIARMDLQRVFDSVESIETKAGIKAALVSVYESECRRSLTNLYPVHQFQEDLATVLGSGAVLDCQAEDEGIRSIAKTGAALSMAARRQLTQFLNQDQFDYYLPRLFAELLFALKLHTDVQMEYEAARQKNAGYLGTILEESEFNSLADKILVEWRAPRYYFESISKILRNFESAIPQNPAQAIGRDERTSRKRQIKLLKDHYLEQSANVDRYLSFTDILEFVESLDGSISFSVFMKEIDLKIDEIDRLAIRQKVVSSYENMEDYISEHYPRQEFDQDVSDLLKEKDIPSIQMLSDELMDRIIRIAKPLKARRQAKLSEEQRAAEIVAQRDAQKIKLENHKEKVWQFLQLQRKPEDTEEDLKRQLNYWVEKWEENEKTEMS